MSDDFLTPKEKLHAEFVKKIARGLTRLNENESRQVKTWLNFESFTRCGKNSGACTWCTNCDEEHELKWCCSKKWCPLCNWKITEARREKLLTFTRGVHNPQHLVLTQRNFKHLDGKIREMKQNLVKLRRNRIWDSVKGGCTSIEMTNKGEGWHLHSHSLIDCRYISASELAIEWGRLCGQTFGIVHRDNIDSINYEKEICKYVVKPSEMIKWRTSDVFEFLKEIHRQRFFFTFGTMKLFKPIKNARAQGKCETCHSEGFLEFLPELGMRIDSKIKFISRR